MKEPLPASTTRWFRLVLLVVLATTVCAACATEEAEPSIFEEIGLVVAPSNVADTLTAELELQREASDAAAICMRGQGYNYIPWTPVQIVAPAVLDAPPFGTEAFALELGYGILFNLPKQLQTHPSAKRDPNQVFVDGLTPEERMVYYQTLLGADGGDGTRRADVDEAIYDEGGCLGRELRERGDFNRSNLLGNLQASFEDLEARANADTRLLDYDAEWAACMAAAGYRYASSHIAQGDFRARFNAIWSTAEFPAAALSVSELRELSSSDRAELYESAPVFDEEMWATALSDEIAVATQDLRCQGENARFDVYVEVLMELEDQFVSEHRNEVDRLRDD